MFLTALHNMTMLTDRLLTHPSCQQLGVVSDTRPFTKVWSSWHREASVGERGASLPVLHAASTSEAPNQLLLVSRVAVRRIHIINSCKWSDRRPRLICRLAQWFVDVELLAQVLNLA